MCILLVVACIFTGGIWRKKRRNGHKVDASCGFKSLSVNTFTPPPNNKGGDIIGRIFEISGLHTASQKC